MKERKEKRKNIIIKGVEMNENNIKKKWMLKKLGIAPKVKTAEKVVLRINKKERGKGILVRLQDINMKGEVMIRRKNLKGISLSMMT